VRAHPARTHLALVTLAILAALASSCARGLPTAARTEPPTRALASRLEGQELEGEVAVTLLLGVAPADVAASHGATVLEWDAGERLASFLPGPGDTPAALLARLLTDPRVSSAESNSRFEPAEGRQKSFAFDDGHNTASEVNAQPALAAVHALEALAISRGDGVRVAILDTGIDPSHPLFAGRIAGAHDFVEGIEGAAEIAYGVDSNNDGFVDGAWGHGTHVAGIVSTVAPGARLLIARVLDSDGQGDVITVASGIRWAVQHGANVINLSLGSLSRSEAIANALEDAEEHGVIVFASAGNWGAATPQEFPARDEGTRAVAATDAYAAPAPWSSYAPYVVISAPGVAIRSAYPGGLYRQWSGTSMSTPFASATAALLLARHPEWHRSDVMARIASSATPLVNVTGDRVGMFGAGMLDIGQALAPDAPEGDEGSITQPGHH
jgi:subtilisin family serine protease